ncbi:C39 family peptidase [Vagococcus teuberi]|uniref:Peptidase C39-like domain-containing protein n=1 Tax=Vagococcus teuberi TaxID=519472 RepID=A0A1J0A734_9ENTE|nr:C39 family peptidase [Vagococcus teuberi]APB31719.1 hypothetical protein BHY08_07685 [Vagococcus teuberi]
MKSKKFNYVMLTVLLANIATYPVIGLAENTSEEPKSEKINGDTSTSSQVINGQDNQLESATSDSILTESEMSTQTTSLDETTATTTTDTSEENKEEIEKTRAVINEKLGIKYEAHIQNLGWQKEVNNGELAGTTGRNLALEGLKISLDKTNSDLSGGIEYRSHVRNIGWQNWTSEGQIAGTVGKALPTEAYQIRLTGEIAEKYNIYYRVHTTNLGWLGWAKNGEMSGSEGFAYNVQAIEIKLLEKNETPPTSTETPYVKKTTLNYQAHVQDIGWQSNVSDGKIAGTTGRNKGVEGLKINLSDAAESGNIQYRAHVRNIGWQDWVTGGQLAGTVGKALPTEAYEIKLTGELAKNYDVYYRVHSSNVGWLGWAKNGQSAGTQGFAFKVEAIEVRLIPKYTSAPALGNAFLKSEQVSYQTHVKNIGWQNAVTSGAVAGTTGRNLWVEGLKLSVPNQTISGSIQYKSHIRNIGWQDWVENGQLAGTVGRALPTEAYQIRLTGELSKIYDVYYRVHAQNFGWLGWAKNGQSAGTEGYAYHVEAIQVTLVPKGGSAPGKLGDSFRVKKTSNIITSVPYVSQYAPIYAPWGCAVASMTMLLRSKGVSVDMKYALDNLPMYPADKGGQKGDVYTGAGFGWVITPQSLTQYMKKWYPNVYNITGVTSNGIKNHIIDGNPVLFYGYTSHQKDTVRNHAKVVVGYKDNKFLVYDPLYYSESAGPMSGGKHPKYDRGAKYWVTEKDFNEEFAGRAIVIK